MNGDTSRFLRLPSLSPLLVSSRLLWVEPHSCPRRTPLPLNYRTELLIHQPSFKLSLGAVSPERGGALTTFRTDCVYGRFTCEKLLGEGPELEGAFL